MLTQKQRDQELARLNQICMNCINEKELKCEPFERKNCMSCPTGLAIHKLDSPDWDKVDWNSAQWEHLYRN